MCLLSNAPDTFGGEIVEQQVASLSPTQLTATEAKPTNSGKQSPDKPVQSRVVQARELFEQYAQQQTVVVPADCNLTVDPDKYFDKVAATLKRELGEITPLTEQLELSVDELTTEISAKTKLLNATRALAMDYRMRFKQAGTWPIEVCGEKYTQERMESQICRLAARAMAFREAVEELQAAREQAEEAIESVTGRPTRLTSQIIITRMLQRLHRIQQLPSAGTQMLTRARKFVRETKGNCHPDELLFVLDGRNPIKPIESARRNIAQRYLNGTGDNNRPKQSQTSTAKPLNAAKRQTPIYWQK